ncbi:MAG: flagellin lysine-N-methylase [Bacilli bacterium]
MTEQGQIWFEPDYFKNFKCKCSECRHCCCSGWKIGISKKEYDNLIKLKCSNKLRKRIENAFVDVCFPTDDLYKRISPNWLNVCPMLDNNGLCLLQKECGVANLPIICNVYPRKYSDNNGYLKATCTCSCEAVVELLIKEDQVNFVYQEQNVKANIKRNLKMDSLEKSNQLISLLQNRNVALNERIANICSLIANKEFLISFDMLGQGLEKLLFVMKKLSFLSTELEESRDFLERKIKESDDFSRNYLLDLSIYKNNYPDETKWLENILVNHFIYSDIPFVDERLQTDQCLPGICLAYALIRLVLVIRTKDNPSVDHFVDILSGLFHFIEHTSFYYNAFVLIKQPEILLTL